MGAIQGSLTGKSWPYELWDISWPLLILLLPLAALPGYTIWKERAERAATLVLRPALRRIKQLFHATDSSFHVSVILNICQMYSLGVIFFPPQVRKESVHLALKIYVFKMSFLLCNTFSWLKYVYINIYNLKNEVILISFSTTVHFKWFYYLWILPCLQELCTNILKKRQLFKEYFRHSDFLA